MEYLNLPFNTIGWYVTTREDTPVAVAKTEGSDRRRSSIGEGNKILACLGDEEKVRTSERMGSSGRSLIDGRSFPCPLGSVAPSVGPVKSNCGIDLSSSRVCTGTGCRCLNAVIGEEIVGKVDLRFPRGDRRCSATYSQWVRKNLL